MLRHLLENYEHNAFGEKSIQMLESFYDYPRGFLLLSGGNGVGKSFVAKTIYHRHTRYKLPQFDSGSAIFITQSELNLRWNKAGEKHEMMHLLEEMCNTKLLVLDDIGTRVPTPAFMDFLYLIADHRNSESESLGTILTTNLGAEQLVKDFGGAFMSRVSSNYVIRVDAPDGRHANRLISHDKAPSLTKQGSSNTIIAFKDNCLRIAYKASNLTIRIFS